MSGDRRAEIERRHAEASEGPWTSDESELVWRLHGVAGRIPPQAGGAIPEQVITKQILKAPKTTRGLYADYWPEPADAEFITHAWEDMRDLLTENRRLQGVLMERSRLTDGEQAALPAFWRDLYENLQDPEFREAYVAASQEIAGADAAAALDELADLRAALLNAMSLPPQLND